MHMGGEEHGLRLVTFLPGSAGDAADARARLGAIRDGMVIDLARAAESAGQRADAPELRDMLALIAGGAPALARVASVVAAAPTAGAYARDAVRLLAPIARPRKNIFCVGRNYKEHANEVVRAGRPEITLTNLPNIFTKAPTTVSGPYDDIPLDATISTQIDWEAELAVIIGAGGRHIAERDALAHVWGYTIINDVTARDIQHQGGIQWFLGKNLDGSCPMGPVAVTADAIPDPQRLGVSCAVNGTVKQQDTTAHMIFTVAALVAAISRILSLEPGDIIATGTPGGVGFARKPPEFLKPGDVLQTTVEHIGTLHNRIVAAG